MGKSSKKPQYSSGGVIINGHNVSSAHKNGNSINSSYNMTDKEKEIYSGIQDNLSSSLGDLFEFSDEKLDLWKKQLDNYKEEGIKNINEIYEPMQNNLKNDIASRFGNLDNSIFMDNLNKITDNKAEAVSDLSKSVLEKQDKLYYNEMANRLNYIALLNNLNSAMNNNMLAYMEMAQSNAESGNKHNLANSQSNGFNNTLGAINSIGKTALSFVNPISSIFGK